MDGLGSFARFHVRSHLFSGFEFRQIQMKATELSFQGERWFRTTGRARVPLN